MSLYDKLGLDRNASKVEIKKAFRSLSLQHHPDRGGDTAHFQEINEAYEILIDDQKKQRYDATGQVNDQPQQHQPRYHPFMDMFGGFDNFYQQHFFHQNFNPPKQEKKKLEEIKYPLEITMEEAYFGTVKNIGINLSSKCVCVTFCDNCNSQGVMKRLVQINPFQQIMMEQHCEKCEGRGFMKSNCDICKNSCQINHTELFQIKIGDDIESNFQYRFADKGRQPFKPHELAGDLVVEIKIKDHPKFKKVGKNLHFNLEVDLEESIVGKDVNIPHFENQYNLDTSIFGIVQDGKEYTVKEKGMKGGDLIVKINIKYPTELFNKEAREILKEAFKKIKA